MADTFLTGKIAAIEALINVYDAALLALGEGGMQTYTLDTGQDRQTVTKLDVASLTRTRGSLYNERATLLARCTGDGTIIARPSW